MASEHPREPHLLPSDRGHAAFVEDRAPLFAGRRLGIQVKQEQLGDCFFLAPLASLAERRPEEVRAAIRELDGDRYAVRLFHRDHDGFTPREVEVTGKIPEEDGAPIYATTTGRRALWVSLFEKAFAEVRRGYRALDRGGDALFAVEALTGRRAHDTWLEHQSPDAVWDLLSRAAADRRITLASTFSDDDARAMLARRHRAGDASLSAEEREAFSYARHGLVSGHVYSVWALSGSGDDRRVQLRNPWAYGEPRGSGPDDGMFSFPFHRLMLLFAIATVEG